jgi:hypothetical protein
MPNRTKMGGEGKWLRWPSHEPRIGKPFDQSTSLGPVAGTKLLHPPEAATRARNLNRHCNPRSSRIRIAGFPRSSRRAPDLININRDLQASMSVLLNETLVTATGTNRGGVGRAR